MWQDQRGVGQGVATELGPIDFAAAARAFGAEGIHVATDAEFEPALRQRARGGRPDRDPARPRPRLGVRRPSAWLMRATYHLIPVEVWAAVGSRRRR